MISYFKLIFTILYFNLKLLNSQLVYKPTPNRDLYDIYRPIYNYDTSIGDENSTLIGSFMMSNKYDCFRKCSSNNQCLMVSYKSNQLCKHFNKVKYTLYSINSMVLFEKIIQDTSSSIVSYLTYYWPFNNDVKDVISGVTLTGGSTTGKSFSQDRMNKDYSALYLQNAYYNFPSGVYIYADSTVSVWVKLRSLQTWSSLLTFGTTGGIHTYESFWFSMSYESSARPNLYACLSYSVSSTALTIGKWFHLAYTISGATTSIYINGKLVVQTPNHCSVPKVTRAYSSLGAQNHVGTIYWLPNTDFDDLKIFNKSLTQDEILIDMNTYY